MHSTLKANVDPKLNQAISKTDSHFCQEVVKATTLMNANRAPNS